MAVQRTISLAFGGATQSLHFFLVDFYLAGLLHLLAQVGDEQAKQLVLLLLQQRISNFVFLGCEVGVRGLLLLEHLEDRTIRSAVDRTADLALFQAEGCRWRTGHR